MTTEAVPAARAREFRVSYDASLVEEAVLRAEATRGGAEPAAFRLERDPLYRVSDPEEREARFAELHGRWFSRLGLDRPLHEALAEVPDLRRRTGGCLVVRAASRKEETADLIGLRGAGLPTLLIRLRPEALLEGKGLVRFLRHELAHVADMLEPAFGYDRSLPPSDGGPSHELLLRDRYRTVWCTTIEGRHFHRGLAGTGDREARRREFARAFPMLEDATAAAFGRWFDEPHPTHGAILAFVRAPAPPS